MKGTCKCGILLFALTMLAIQPVFAFENGDDHAKTSNNSTHVSSSADRWFATSRDTPSMTAKIQKDVARYAYLLNDNGFDYYMDTKNVRWINMPYTSNERIVDVWIYIVPDSPQKSVQEDGKGNYEYKSGSTYYLEHYYLRPKTKQIQFLSELEVTGRPDNAVKERPYNVQNWENLVPGSIEDDIYHQAMKNMPKNKLGGHSFGGKSLRDIIEDTVNISL